MVRFASLICRSDGIQRGRLVIEISSDSRMPDPALLITSNLAPCLELDKIYFGLLTHADHRLTVLEVRLLSDGYFTLDKSFLVFGKYQGIKYKAALKPLLVKTEKETILVDTGVGNLPPKYQKFHDVIRNREEELAYSLHKAGVRPEDVTMVVNTHLHFDHCGNNRMFPKSKFLVQTDEIRYAYYPDRFMRVSYLRDFFDVEGDYLPVRGRYEIEDGVEILPTPGHTIGHQSLVVRWKNRNVVYAGDAAPLAENIEKRNITGMIYDSARGAESIDMLRRIENPVYIYSHDNEQLKPEL